MHNFHEASRVWIYMSDRPFTNEEIGSISEDLNHFCKDWSAHGNNLQAAGKIYFDRFIVLMVDETAAGASGCSIDKSVHFLQSVEKKYGLQLFNRLLVAWKNAEEIQVAPLNMVQHHIESQDIQLDTMIFNNAVATKKEMDENWMLPFHKSWMYPRFSAARKVMQ